MAENKTYRLADNEALAQARYVRSTPMKTRRVVDLIRGLKAEEALDVLRFTPQAASEPVSKVLASAMANAENNKRLDRGALWVSAAYVDEGPTMKRFRPRAQGRAFRIRKRTSHITVVVQARTPASTGRAATGGGGRRTQTATGTATATAVAGGDR